MAERRNIWTVPHPKGGWGNKREGSERFLDRAETKAAAQVSGRARALKDKVEHVILKRDGQIGERNSYGGDSPRRKG
jgi:hypothetical protein